MMFVYVDKCNMVLETVSYAVLLTIMKALLFRENAFIYNTQYAESPHYVVAVKSSLLVLRATDVITC